MSTARQSGPDARPIRRLLVWMLGMQIVLCGGILLLALDMYAHARVGPLGGVNIWGYRGPIVPGKRSHEVRVLLVGGTRAFGWGMVASATTAPALYTRIMLAIDRPGTDPPALKVVNLGRVGDLPEAYPKTIEHYRYLAPDVICIYDDLGVRGGDPAVFDSAVFALTGYAPILPLVAREKGLSLRFGSVDRGYAGVAGPNVSPVRRAVGLGLESVGSGISAIDTALGRRIAGRDRRSADGAYADHVLKTIEVARQHARGVILAVSPAELDVQRQNLLAVDRVRRQFETTSWFRFVNLESAPELRDPALRLDGWNYGGEATWAVARAITPAILELMGYR